MQRLMPSAFLAMVFAASATAQAPPQARPCGPSAPEQLEEAIDLLASPDFQSTRARLGLEGADPQDVEQLGDHPRESAICARLRATLPQGVRVEGAQAPSRASYFRTGDFFVVTIRARPISEQHPVAPGPDQTFVFSPDFVLLGGFALR